MFFEEKILFILFIVTKIGDKVFFENIVIKSLKKIDWE